MSTEGMRRIVYLPPDQWRLLRVAAAERGTSVSGLLRTLIDGGLLASRTLPTARVAESPAPSRPRASAPTQAPPPGSMAPTRPMTQAQRDAILRKVNRATSI